MVCANYAALGMWRAGSGIFQPLNDVEIDSGVGRRASYFGRGLNQPLSVEEEAVSALAGPVIQFNSRSVTL